MFQQDETPQEVAEEWKLKNRYDGQKFEQIQEEGGQPPYQPHHKPQSAHHQPQPRLQKENITSRAHVERQHDESRAQFYVNPKQKQKLRDCNPPPEQVQDQNLIEDEYEFKYMKDCIDLLKLDEDDDFCQIQSQELPQHQTGGNSQMYQLQGQSVQCPEMIDTVSQQPYLTGQPNSGPQSLLMHLEGDPNEPVLCPMAKLPHEPCLWKGIKRWRKGHIEMNHYMYLSTNNYVALTFNRVAILSVYTEYFLCYTVTKDDPKKLFCVAQHACQSHNCMLTYQYRCEIRAANGYEKITETRLVAHIADDFTTLNKLGKCVRFDAEVITYFVGTDELNVNFEISIPEPV
ncbi:uncharacterized protein LOC110837182 isoform X2 [Zootermopsis nevadensis]|uniref:Uncharacterized protein n=2 Tax=Zootermopsis nevadensis TaxID=136037 RepID=A0A067QP24_ZOONE|nr:uncharacterized protein LOC110837182 isoform X2 [Zootermopsis nevadensis]KDR11343.1 hypothetical protein L798_14885 [Zootermopsis nevadensis]